ncbi:MAG: GNAT family N-acetyltransferase [Tannerella sp.]|jgi:GNAT superfamily N-acetyltransferase|nr:GNAT family N-acetyltransferase [Tannerella sp.]
MSFLDTCRIFPLNDDVLKQCQPFSCGDEDLDDFFLNNAGNYNRQLLGKSYCFRQKKELSIIVCACTLSNSSIDARNLPNNRRKKLTENIPYEKQLSSYPATLIGRLGVNKNYKGIGIGTALINFVKFWILKEDTKTGCRYLTVDAYNNELTRKYYEANGFKYLFSTERQEKEYIGLPDDKELRTRLMYFDLMLM